LLDLTQYVADLGSEELLGDDAEEQEIQRHKDKQRHLPVSPEAKGVGGPDAVEELLDLGLQMQAFRRTGPCGSKHAARGYAARAVNITKTTPAREPGHQTRRGTPWMFAPPLPPPQASRWK
jgi:hypothetical protein